MRHQVRGAQMVRQIAEERNLLPVDIRCYTGKHPEWPGGGIRSTAERNRQTAEYLSMQTTVF